MSDLRRSGLTLWLALGLVASAWAAPQDPTLVFDNPFRTRGDAPGALELLLDEVVRAPEPP